MKSFHTTLGVLLVAFGTECAAQTVSGQQGGHNYVDLGLPSGTLWATSNIGAENPLEYGEYFAWGETSGKDNYDWESYQWSKSFYNALTKYCVSAKYGKKDNLTTLTASDDAATDNWGASWRMPTLAELKELIDGCNWTWTNGFHYGVACKIGTSKVNGNVIFLPASGDQYGQDVEDAGFNGDYWSSTLCANNLKSASAYVFSFDNEKVGCYDVGRETGRSVRAVVKK